MCTLLVQRYSPSIKKCFCSSRRASPATKPQDITTRTFSFSLLPSTLRSPYYLSLACTRAHVVSVAAEAHQSRSTGALFFCYLVSSHRASSSSQDGGETQLPSTPQQNKPTIIRKCLLQLKETSTRYELATRSETEPREIRTMLTLITLNSPEPGPVFVHCWAVLNQDELQRDARHVQFDFTRLCEVAVRLSDGATQVASHEKKEGGYSKVFILTFDTGKRLVAMIPTQVAGAPRFTTNSEVATIMYCM